jgi:hypothetical protein
MLVSAHRKTMAAAISAGVQARLSSVRSIDARLCSAGQARVQSTAARVQRKGPSRLVARIAAQKSSLSRSSSAGGIGSAVAEVPALLTRKSSRPSAPIASCTIRSAVSGLETSPGAAMTAKPCAPQKSFARKRPGETRAFVRSHDLIRKVRYPSGSCFGARSAFTAAFR